MERMATMRKEGQNMGSMLYHGADAFAVGAGAAALVALIRQVAEARRQKKKEEERVSDKIGPNTIVLTIGKNRKTAEDGSCQESCDSHDKVCKVESSVDGEIWPVFGQPRKTNGQYTSLDSTMGSEKRAFLSGPMDQAGNILSAIGGGVAGYVVVSKIAEKLEQKRLKKQVDAAQREYVQLLSGGRLKAAEAFSDLFMFGDDSVEEFEKSAGVITDIVSLPGGISRTTRNIGGAALASYILATGGAAYIVKKLLEERFSKKEEEPEQKTRILFKSGSFEREIEPEQMLATVGILRDCIADSLPMSKMAGSDIDYGFLNDIANAKGGKQYILDQYAKTQGLKRDDSDFSMPMSTLFKYGPSLHAYQKNPEMYQDAVKSHVMQLARNNPEEWFELLGQERNRDLVRMKADERIAGLHNGSGFLSTLASIPLIGPLVKRIVGWYANNTASGRKRVAGSMLSELGVSPEAINDMLSRYDFSKGGWTRLDGSAFPGSGVQKTASLNDLLALSSRLKTVKDNSNKEVIDAINRIKEDMPRRKGKPQEDKKVVVEFDEDLDGVIPEEYRDRLAKALEAANV